MNKNLYKTIINRNTGLIAVVAENKMAVFSVSSSVKGDNPNQNSRIYTVNQSGMSSIMGYGKESNKQYATTHSGINTANITIRDSEKQQQITGKTAEETIKAVKTDVTIDNYAEHSGSLKNNFDKEKVLKELVTANCGYQRFHD